MLRLTNAAIITEKKVVASKKDKRQLLYNILFSSQQKIFVLTIDRSTNIALFVLTWRTLCVTLLL